MIKKTIPTLNNINKTIPVGINMGDKTHHQDHFMYPVSFKPINRTVNKPKNPIPPDDVLRVVIFVLVRKYDAPH